jgi:hypothetical protein
VLIVSGVIVGPQVLDLAEPESIELLSNVGQGFLFLLAGYELELALFRQRAGKLAVIAWVASAVLAGVLVGLLASMGLVCAFVPVALGLTTTALGTLLPRHRRSTHSGPGARSASHSRFRASTKPSQPTNRSSVPSSMRRSPLTGSRQSSSWSWTVSSRFLSPVAASSIGIDGIPVRRSVASGRSPKSFPELSRRSSSGRGDLTSAVARRIRTSSS